jgi:hypothetical protein
MSWYRAPLWGLRPDITSCRNVAVWNLRVAPYYIRMQSVPNRKHITSPLQSPACYYCSRENHCLLWGEVTLRLAVSQSVCLGIEHPCGTCDLILLPHGRLLSQICGLVSVRRPLWREDGSVIYSVITQWSESLRTRNHTLQSHLRLPQPGGPGEVRWGYFTTDSKSVCLGIEHPCGTCDQILLPVWMLLSESCDLVSVGRPLWREVGSAICNVNTQWSESRITRNHTLLCHLRLSQPEGQVRWGEVTLRLTVSQYVLVSSTLVGLATRYYFLTEGCCLKVAILFLWGALSDERTCLQFVV